MKAGFPRNPGPSCPFPDGPAASDVPFPARASDMPFRDGRVPESAGPLVLLRSPAHSRGW